MSFSRASAYCVDSFPTGERAEGERREPRFLRLPSARPPVLCDACGVDGPCLLYSNIPLIYHSTRCNKDRTANRMLGTREQYFLTHDFPLPHGARPFHSATRPSQPLGPCVEDGATQFFRDYTPTSGRKVYVAARIHHYERTTRMRYIVTSDIFE